MKRINWFMKLKHSCKNREKAFIMMGLHGNVTISKEFIQLSFSVPVLLYKTLIGRISLKFDQLAFRLI